MKIEIGVVMDPIESINPKKDSTFAILLAAAKRGWEIQYMQQHDLFSENGSTHACMQPLQVKDQLANWFTTGTPAKRPLHQLDIILMRADPPVDSQYLYTTYLLERAEEQGALIINKPAGLRDINEKLFISRFAEWCAPTLVSRNQQQLREFLDQHQTIIVKPLDGMGGMSIFKLKKGGDNLNVILETLTQRGRNLIMAQRYIPEISAGDKRILMLDGEPYQYALARIPAPGEHRGNLAAGGSSKGVALSARDRTICKTVGPALREKGILFAGIDVIGDYLTEINVTSPTCIRELDALYHEDIAGQLLEHIAARLKKN